MKTLLQAAHAEGRSLLLEHELLPILEARGLPVPAWRFLPLAELSEAKIPFPRAVMKLASPEVLHKSDMGGLCFLEVGDDLQAAAAEMLAGLPEMLRPSVLGFLLEERLEFQPGLGRELLLGMRHSSAFGSVFTLGFGGTYVEALAEASRRDQSTLLFHPEINTPSQIRARLSKSLFFRWMSGGVRGVKGLTSPEEMEMRLLKLLMLLTDLEREAREAGFQIDELELNPLVWAEGWRPVDALLRFSKAPKAPPEINLSKLKRALSPRAVALVGVSRRMNMGRIILQTALKAGFPPDRLYPIKGDLNSLDGVTCIPSLAALPEPVDLLVVAIGARAVPELLSEGLQSGKLAGGVLLIPGGMGETEGGKVIAAEIEALMAAEPEPPVLLGNNSLGLVSKAARFDSLFIPEIKLPRVRDGRDGLAIISQSGAFMITQLSKLDDLSPEYQISLGNQMDVRISHVLEALADDPKVRTFGLYVEGLKPGDGARLLPIIRRLRAEGRDVIAYKGGRSRLGKAATEGHTASVAGDYRVFQDLLEQSGALVAETFTTFRDLISLSLSLSERPKGRRVALMSNAGYESVGMADATAGLEPATFSAETHARIEELLRAQRIDSLVSVHNPLDLTPMANDEVHIETMRAILEDPGVDCAIFGNVPMTPQVQTLPRGRSEHDIFDAPQGYLKRLIQLSKEISKPSLIILDAGPYYDPMFQALRAAGFPVFRDADRATRLLSLYLSRTLP